MRFTKKYGGNIWYNICLFTFMSPLFSYMYVYLDEYIFHKKSHLSIANFKCNKLNVNYSTKGSKKYTISYC